MTFDSHPGASRLCAPGCSGVNMSGNLVPCMPSVPPRANTPAEFKAVCSAPSSRRRSAGRKLALRAGLEVAASDEALWRASGPLWSDTRKLTPDALPGRVPVQLRESSAYPKPDIDGVRQFDSDVSFVPSPFVRIPSRRANPAAFRTNSRTG
jgi:hypothetical protein